MASCHFELRKPCVSLTGFTEYLLGITRQAKVSGIVCPAILPLATAITSPWSYMGTAKKTLTWERNDLPYNDVIGFEVSGVLS